MNTAIVLLVPRPTDYSFQSGHASFSFAAVFVLMNSDSFRKLRVPARVLACLIAFLRMYLYLHYPAGILTGIVTGLFCGWAAYRIADHLAHLHIDDFRSGFRSKHRSDDFIRHSGKAVFRKCGFGMFQRAGADSICLPALFQDHGV